MLKKNFKIDLSIYSKENIINAIKDFEDNGFDVILKNEEIFIVGETEDEIEEIFNEFMNYVILL